MLSPYLASSSFNWGFVLLFKTAGLIASLRHNYGISPLVNIIRSRKKQRIVTHITERRSRIRAKLASRHGGVRLHKTRRLSTWSRRAKTFHVHESKNVPADLTLLRFVRPTVFTLKPWLNSLKKLLQATERTGFDCCIVASCLHGSTGIILQWRNQSYLRELAAVKCFALFFVRVSAIQLLAAV